MKRNCNIKNIAEYANVSRSTVSRVLNNVQTKIPVSAETRKLILDTAKKLNYHPNINAQRLANKKSHVIGLQIPSNVNNKSIFYDINFIEVLSGIEKAICHSAYRLQLIFCNQNYIDNKEYLSLLQSNSIDGLIIWGALTVDVYAEELFKWPVIMINSLSEQNKECSSISHDDYKGSFDLTGAIYAGGARKFIYLNGSERVSITEKRFKGFKDALIYENLSPANITVLDGDFSKESGYMRGQKIFSGKKTLDFDAVICANDLIALGVIEAAKENNFVPQKDFVLAGADGIREINAQNLYSYKCDHNTMGSTAVNKLIEHIEEENSPKINMVLPVTNINF